MPSDIAPLQGFGEPITASDLSDNVLFSVVVEGNQLAQWKQSPVIKQFPIPGSFPPRFDTQLLGYTPATVTWKLEIDTLAEYQRFVAMLTSEHTLTVIHNTQTHPGTIHEINRVKYVELPNTMLMDLDNVTSTVEGVVRVDATFQRIIDPTTSLVVP